MTAMGGSEQFLDKPAAELEELLLRLARSDAAPPGARERALQKLASAALGLSVLTGTAALGSRSTLLKGTTWLVAKWLAVGASSGLLGIGVAQGVQELAAKPVPTSSASHAATAHRRRQVPAQAAPVAQQVSAPVEPTTEPTPAPQTEATLMPSAAATTSPPHEAKSAARAAEQASVADVAAPNTKTSLTRQLTLLEQASSALRLHATSQALQALDDYRAEFPRGSMLVEAEALRVEAVAQSGDRAAAQNLARIFLSNFPPGPLAARVRAVSEVSIAGEQKP